MNTKKLKTHFSKNKDVQLPQPNHIQIIFKSRISLKILLPVPDSSKLKAGIFTEVLTEILQNTSQETSGENNESGAVAPMPLYAIFQTVMSDICPWTVSFAHLTSTENTTKGTLSIPNIAKGVEITKWKELNQLSQ